MDVARPNPATDPGHFVTDALARLEADIRELALLTLADWERCGIVVADLFRPVAALQRPSWGHWNGLLTALRQVYRAVLRGASEAEQQRLQGASVLSAVMGHLDQEVEPAVVELVRQLAELTRVNLGRRPKLGALLALPIALRNLVAHFAPAEAEWWARAAAALEPLAAMREQGRLRPGGDFMQARPAPWFLEAGGVAYAFNGLRGDTPVYAALGGAPREAPEQLGAVLMSFRRLLGKADEQEGNLRRLLAQLVPEDLKSVLLGDYLVGRPVGSGGQATVHVATQLSTGRKVAVKLLRDGLGDDVRDRFRQEAAFLSRLAHPNVVGILGYGEDAWAAPRDPAVAQGLAAEPWFQELAQSAPVKSYLAMEWVEGHTLEDVFQGKRLRPDVRGLADWLGQAAEALSVVHAAGLIHRDVKPANLMVTEAGVIKLMDFGIARTRDPGRSPLTTPGRVLGTPAYMAPEQMAGRGGDEEFSPVGDVYGLCATFYELFTGARLFQHDRDTEKAVETRKLAGERPERPRRLASGLPWEVETILLGGLEPGPPERYRSAGDLARDVRHYLRDEPIEYRRPSAWRRCRLFYRRQRALVNLLAAALVLAIGGTAGYIVSIHQEQEQTRKQRETAERRLVRSYLREGVRQIDAGNPLAGLPFFAAAYRQAEEANLGEGDAHRLRLGAMLAAAPKRLRHLPHTHAPSHLAVSPDGRFLVTAAEYPSGKEPSPEQILGAVWLWDAASGDRLAGPLHLDDPVRAFAFSPAGDRLAIGTGDRTGRQGAGEAIVLTLPGLEEACPPLRHPGPRKNEALSRAGMQRGQQDWVRRGVGLITAVAFTPDGRRLITCSDEGTARVWDSRTGKPVGEPLRHGRGVAHSTLTPDGSALVTIDEQGELCVWDLKTGRPRLEPGKVKMAGRAFAVHPNGKRLAAGDYSGGVEVWDLAAGTRVLSITGAASGPIDGVEFSPDGQLLLVAERQAVMLWEVSNHERLVHRLAHKDLRSAAFSADGLTVVTVGDGVRFWDIRSGHECFPRLPDDGAVLHPEGYRVYTIRDGAAWLWQLPLAAPCPVPSPTSAEPASADLQLAPDCRTCLFTFLDTRVRPVTVHCALVDTRTGLPVCPGWSHPLADDHKLAAAFRPDGGLVATTGSEGCVELRPSAAGTSAPPTLRHPGPVTLLTFHPDGGMLATAGKDRKLRLWDLTAGRQIGEPIACTDPLHNVRFSPDGALFVTAAQGEQGAEVRVWATATGAPVVGPLKHAGRNLDVWVLPGPGRVVAAGEQGVGVLQHHVYLWDLADGRAVCAPLELSSPQFDADGGRMLADGRMFETRTGLPVAEAPDQIAAWLPAAGVMATSVRITETEQGFRVRRGDGSALGPAIPVPPGTEKPTFSPDGRLLAALGGGTVAHIWEVQTGDPVLLPWPVPESAAPPRFTPDGRSVVVLSRQPHLGAWALCLPFEPFTGSAEEAGDRARLLAGVGLDDAGGLVRLDLRAEWERQSPTPEAAPAREQLRGWHLARAAQCPWGNWAGAVLHLRRAAEYGADGPEVFTALGKAYLHLGRWADARAAFCRAVAGGAGWRARSGRAESFVGLKEWKQALADFDAAVAAGATDMDLLLGRAAARAEAGDPAGAERDIEEAVGERNDLGLWLTYSVRDRLAAGDWRAVAALVDYLEPRYRRNRFLLITTDALRPAEMYASRGVARFLLDDIRGALADFEAGGQVGGAGAGFVFAAKAADDRLALAPGDARLLHLRGLARSRLGKADAALADLRAALRADPGRFRVWWTLAAVCEGRADWPAAEKAYTEGIVGAVKPPATAFYRRGWCRAEQQNWELAEEDFDDYVGREPADSNGWSALALARLGGGDRDGFRDVLARLRTRAESKNQQGDDLLRAWTLLAAVGDDRVKPAELQRAAERLGAQKAPPVWVRAAVVAAWCRCARFDKAAEALAPVGEKEAAADPLLGILWAACAAAQGKAEDARAWADRAARAADHAGWQDRLCHEEWLRRPAPPAAGKPGPR